MRDVPNLMDKKLLHKNRTLQKRKNIARKYEYSREVLIYMLQTGIRWEVEKIENNGTTTTRNAITVQLPRNLFGIGSKSKPYWQKRLTLKVN